MNSTLLESVRRELVAEAQSSPKMLQDLAGLERYVAQTYATRSFVELLQNADDAGATRVKFGIRDEHLFCANDGRLFSESDFRSLCRSASSSKRRGDSIGYRGIGFKSVAGIASRVHLISGDLEATFDRELTRRDVGGDGDTPLIRIPHAMALNGESQVLRHATDLVQSGFNTVFILDGLDRIAVEEELVAFDSDYLIFLRNVEGVDIATPTGQSRYSCARQPAKEGLTISTTSPTGTMKWWVTQQHGTAAACLMDNGIPVALKGDQAYAHAFLPTQEITGLGLRLNADFSTDPSRTRIVLDDVTERCIVQCVSLLSDLTMGAIKTDDSFARGLIAAVTPTVDINLIGLQRKRFSTELISIWADRLRELTAGIDLAPRWIPTQDASALGGRKGIAGRVLPHPSAEGSAKPGALPALLQAIGKRPLPHAAAASAVLEGGMSIDANAQTVALAVRNLTQGLVDPNDLVAAPIWRSTPGDDVALSSLDQASFSPDFVAALKRAGTSWETVHSALLRYLDDQDAFATSSEAEVATALNSLDPGIAPIPPGSDAGHLLNTMREAVSGQSAHPGKWRSAELLVLSLLQDLGFKADDRSHENVGFDIQACHGTDKFLVEVKSLSSVGQPFALTPNEESTARLNGANYWLALVLRTRSAVQVQFIRDPLAAMDFVKQCRQWAWECPEYTFTPNHTFPADG